MRVVPVPCLKDNYAYLVICEETGATAVIDPSEAEPVQVALAKEGLTLSAILNTHHHGDHVGGNLELLDMYPDIPVYGHVSDATRIPGLNHPMDAGDPFQIGQLEGVVLFNPGHTHGAVSYFFPQVPALFTGDTLFSAGCGRIFEGTPEQMYHSINDVIGSCPDDTHIYCGHEYTLNNLRFAVHIEPDNSAIAVRQQAAEALQNQGLPTIPVTLGQERDTNPFLRVHVPAVQARVIELLPGTAQRPVPLFAALRQLKDQF
jgi:hydroxyacylglutathione hydrolase